VCSFIDSIQYFTRVNHKPTPDTSSVTILEPPEFTTNLGTLLRQ